MTLVVADLQAHDAGEAHEVTVESRPPLTYAVRCVPELDLDTPRGTEWTEASFGSIHPQLVRHYASAREG